MKIDEKKRSVMTLQTVVLYFGLSLLKGSTIIYSGREILAQMINVSFPVGLCDECLYKHCAEDFK